MINNHNDVINVLYINIASFSNKFEYFKQELQCISIKPSIIILTEINAKNYKYPLLESELQIDRYNVHFKKFICKRFQRNCSLC